MALEEGFVREGGVLLGSGVDGSGAGEDGEQFVVFVSEGERVEFEETQGRRVVALEATQEMTSGVRVKEVVFDEETTETEMGLQHTGEGEGGSVAKATVVHLQ